MKTTNTLLLINPIRTLAHKSLITQLNVIRVDGNDIQKKDAPEQTLC